MRLAATAAGLVLFGASAVMFMSEATLETPEIPAFPEARGAGASALQPCRSLPLRVHFVTSTNSSGTGTLRAALEAVDNQHFDFILFRTGGRIALTANINMTTSSFSCVYVAGQTAPGGGITVTGRWINIQPSQSQWNAGGRNDDVVWRYMTMRKHVRFNVTAQTSVFDHITSTWTGSSGNGGHDALTVGGTPGGVLMIADRLTVSNSAFYEMHNAHPTGPHLRARSMSLYRNAFFGPGHRLPQINMDTLSLAEVSGAEVVNNLGYNWSTGSGGGDGVNTALSDFTDNYYKRGPATNTAALWRRFPFQMRFQCTAAGEAASTNACVASYHLDGNRSQESDFEPIGHATATSGLQRQLSCHLQNSHWDPGCPTDGDPVPGIYLRSEPLTIPTDWPYVRLPMTDSLVEAIGASLGNSGGLTCEGSWVERRDSLDAAAVANFFAGTGRSSPWNFDGEATPDPNTAPVVPIPAAGTSCADADSDGLPDVYEIAVCGTSTCLNAGAATVSGYLELEHYLNGSDRLNPAPWDDEFPTFNGRWFYVTTLVEVPFGGGTILRPDTLVIPRTAQIPMTVYNHPISPDSVLALVCEAYGPPMDSTGVVSILSAWQPEGDIDVAYLRNRPIPGSPC